MAKICQISGKRPATGHKRSHSMRATKRRFMPNITKKTILDPETGEKIKINISARAQKTMMKNPAKYRNTLKKLIAKKKSK